MEVVETTTPDINPEILANLDPTLLPSGNTKVTTTIKTYTYEIPGTVYPSPNSSIETTTYSPNISQTTPSKSFVYNKVESNTLNRNVNYASPEPGYNVLREITTTNVSDHPPYQKPPSPVNDRTLIKETVTTRNYQPGYRPDNYSPQPGNKTYIYNETTTTRNVNENAYPGNRYTPPPPPPAQTTYIHKETHNTTTNRNISPYPNGYPPQNPPAQSTTIYKYDSHTTNNSSYPNRPYTPRDTETFDPKHPPYGRQNEPPVNVTYKYSSHTSTTNNVKGGYPPESEPLLGRPFPTDSSVDGPPKKLDDLMAKIGGEVSNPYF